MPESTWALNWLNHNSQRSYPLSETATKTDETGTFTIPDDLILGLYFPVHAGVNVEPEKFYVRRIVVAGNGISISLGYDDGSSDPPIVATANVQLSTHTEYKSYALPGADDFDDSQGKIVIGRAATISGLSAGVYTFSYEGGKLDSDCVRPVIRGVTSIVVVNGNDESEPITGRVRLVAGTNTRITVEQIEGEPTSIRFDAVDGEGLTDDCECEGDEAESPCIRKINGVSPTAQGDFTLVGDDCLTIEPADNGLKLSDTCSKPCCGCTELAVVTQHLERFGDAHLSLTNYVNRLEASVKRMELTVLGSRLSDRGCVEG